MDCSMQTAKRDRLSIFAGDGSTATRCKTVCVTLGERGCAILNQGTYCESPGYKVQVADSVGAGDAFAAALLHGLDAAMGHAPPWLLRQCRRRTGREPARSDARLEHQRVLADAGRKVRQISKRGQPWPAAPPEYHVS